MISRRLTQSTKRWDASALKNEKMGIYFITDPDNYWLEIVPTRK